MEFKKIMKNHTNILLSIVFPNWNGNKSELEPFLWSVKKSFFPKNKLETIMVDNGSTNDCVSFVEKKFPWVKIISLDRNYGFTKAVNIGVKKSSGDCVFVANNDIVLEKNCLHALVSYLKINPNVGVVGGKILDLQNTKKLMCGALNYNYLTGSFGFKPNHDQTQDVDWVAGCGFCTPKKVFNKLGGLDEGFFFASEELDFCLRAKYSKFSVVYHPKAVLWHKSGATIYRREYKDFFNLEIQKSKFRLILKHHKKHEILIALFLQLFIILPIKVVTGKSSLSSTIRAFIQDLKNLPENISHLR